MEAKDTSYWIDRWNNHKTKEKKQYKGKIILLIFVLVVLSAGMGVLAYFATRNNWFVSDSDQSTNNDYLKGEETGFPIAKFEDNQPSNSTVNIYPSGIPDFNGTEVIVLSDNKPNFTEYDLNHIYGEKYSDLDSLGRCGSAVAMIDYSMMPTEKRGDIGGIKPSGWNQKKYPGIVDSEPPYLYNRCHLIAFMLTGQNANEKNLITGTRYFNAELMLPYENEVAHYLYDNSKNGEGAYNKILYRVTPFFKEDELVARGVEMEAYSVEDEGESVCFHVFVYNVQPGIIIDYKTGESSVQ